MAQNTTSNQTKEQNPRQGASTTTGKASDAERERERSIQTQRESGRPSTTSARRGLTSPVYSGSGSPFSLMRRMAEDMDRIFQDFGFGRSGLGLTPSLAFDRDMWRGSSALEQSAWTPQIETFRRGDKLVIRADLPGLKKEDVNVEIDNDVLAISGARSEEREEERDDFYSSERTYGQFYRAIPLPEGIGADQVDASFRDGVLEVTLPAPKQSQRETKRIQIR